MRWGIRMSGDLYVKILGRDPVVISTLLAAVLQMLNMFWLHLSDNETAVVNGAIAIVLGAIATALVSMDRLLPLLAGVAQAILNVGLVFGLPWSANEVGSVLAVVAAVVAFIGVRPQVTASVDKAGRHVAKQPLFRLAA
jgi:hypothetical protein